MCQHDKITLLTLNEVAHRLRLHKSTISRLIKSGELPCCQIGSRKLVRGSDLAAFIDRCIGVGDRDSGSQGVM